MTEPQKRVRRPSPSDAERQRLMLQIADMLREGKTQHEINAVLPIKATRMITEVRKMLGMPLRPHKVTLMDARILALHKEGKRPSEIAAEVGKLDSYVSRSLKRQGIETSQIVRPVTIVGIGTMPQPRKVLKTLREMYPETQWTLARVLQDEDHQEQD